MEQGAWGGERRAWSGEQEGWIKKIPPLKGARGMFFCSELRAQGSTQHLVPLQQLQQLTVELMAIPVGIFDICPS
jgi:hypothetical protein